MDGALYFPYIAVPQSAWWTRTLLYWDSVATITPTNFIDEPELHDPKTLELVRNGLVYQVTPSEAEQNFARTFERFITLQDEHELARRQHSFWMGNQTRIHADKMMLYGLGLSSLIEHGLARADGSQWILVEEATAAQFMAALALSLCESAGPDGWSRGNRPTNERWVPITDDVSSAQALWSGLNPLRLNPANPASFRRAIGEAELANVRSIVLENVLAVPDSSMNVDDLVRFRRKHGDLLPRFRHEMEARLQAISEIDDPVRLQRALDGFAYEVEERTNQASAYLEEAGARRVFRSPIFSLLKFVLPETKEGLEAVKNVLAPGQNEKILEEPLAYLAFANAELIPFARSEIDPLSGIPLVDVMSGQR